MELHAVFKDMNVMWTRWSDYALIKRDGIEYIAPTADASPLTFNCADQPELLVADALELGRQFRIGAENKERMCGAFASRHGLLGLEEEASQYSGSLNDRNYGEPLDSINKELQMLYYHFLYTREEVPPPTPPECLLDLSGFVHYRVTGGRTPQIVWEAETLYEVIFLAYALLISSEKSSLKVCKNCGKVYYNPHAKSEFCSTKCRNYYNVKNFRNRERAK